MKQGPTGAWFSCLIGFVLMAVWLSILGSAHVPPFIAATGPSIATGPSDQVVTAGSQATFVVSGTGNKPLKYQWHKNAAPIPGATAPILKTEPVTSGDDGAKYSAVVSNDGGDIVAAPVTLAVTSTVPQWSLYEIPLTAANSYANPYTDATVTAVFTPPADSGLPAKIVQGFWAGGDDFRVRFTPTLPGVWTYAISSWPRDSGLTVDPITITVVPANPNEHGFVRRDPAHPYHFVYDDGSHYFMMGQTYYNIIENVAAGGSWQTAIRNSKAAGFTKVRILLYSWGPVFNGSGTLYPDVLPYGLGKFGRFSTVPNRGSIADHDQINLEFWNDLDALVNYLHQHGIVADLILFNDSQPSYGEGLHDGTPGRAQNERYIKYALARLAGQTNVIWCMANEYDYVRNGNEMDTERAALANGYSDGPGYTAADAQMNDLGNILKTNDPYFRSDNLSLDGAPRILTTHEHSQPYPFRFLWWNLQSTLGADWFSSATIQQHVPPERAARADIDANAAIVANLGHDMPVVNDEYAYHDMGSNTRTTARNALWAIVTAGGYATFGGDGRTPCQTAGCPLLSGDWVDSPFYGDVHNLVSFIETTNYWERISANSKIAVMGNGTRAYASGPSSLAAGDYIVYVAQPAARGPSFQFNESSESTCAAVDLLDPRTGQLTHEGAMSGAFLVTTPNPVADFVYYLHGGNCGE